MASRDDDSLWTKVINSKRLNLINCTSMAVEMVTYYFQEGLITQRDMDLLMDHRTPTQDRAAIMYNILATKDEEKEIEKIMLGLQKGGNTKAFRIINGAIKLQGGSTDTSSTSKHSAFMMKTDSD